MEKLNNPGLVINKDDKKIQALVTRHYFFLTPSERKIVESHTYTLICTVCRNKRIERDYPPCYGCNGTGKTRAIAYTHNMEAMVKRLIELDSR